MSAQFFRKRCAAFTLIEVLVSLAIFALAAVVLGGTYVNVLAGYDAVAQHNAHEQALRLVRATVLSEPDPRKAREGGTVVLPDNRTARWEARIEETAVADLFQVGFRCEIQEPARAQPWVKEEVFLLLRPTWSDPAVREKLRQVTRARLERERRNSR